MWLTSFRFILAVGCLREASVGIWFSQSTEQIAVVGVSWHGGLPARWYAGGFSLKHERLSPRPSPALLDGLVGCGRQACFLPGALSRWGSLGEAGGEGGVGSSLGQRASVSAVKHRAHTGAERHRVSNRSVFTRSLWR